MHVSLSGVLPCGVCRREQAVKRREIRPSPLGWLGNRSKTLRRGVAGRRSCFDSGGAFGGDRTGPYQSRYARLQLSNITQRLWQCRRQGIEGVKEPPGPRGEGGNPCQARFVVLVVWCCGGHVPWPPPVKCWCDKGSQACLCHPHCPACLLEHPRWHRCVCPSAGDGVRGLDLSGRGEEVECGSGPECKAIVDCPIPIGYSYMPLPSPSGRLP